MCPACGFSFGIRPGSLGYNDNKFATLRAELIMAEITLYGTYLSVWLGNCIYSKGSFLFFFFFLLYFLLNYSYNQNKQRTNKSAETKQDNAAVTM